MTRASWGKAKHEVHALKPEIIALLKQGNNLEGIFNQLTSEKKITIGKSTFKRHATAFRGEASSSADSTAPAITQRKAPLKTSNTVPGTKTAGPQKPTSSFNHDPAASDKDLW